MRRFFLFFIRQLSREFIDFIAKIIQISISLLLLSLIINAFSQQTTFHQQIKNVQGDKKIYVLRDNNTDEYWFQLMNEKKYIQYFSELIDIVLKMKAEFIVMNNTMVTSINNNQIEIIEVTSNFFEKYSISSICENETLEKEFQIQRGQWVDTDELVKVAVLGAAYRDNYSAGDYFTDDYGNQYRIIGFLDRHQFYTAPVQGSEINSLDTAVITPVYINESDSESMYYFLYGCQFLVDDVSELDELIQKNNEMKLLDTWLQSYNTQLEYVDEEYINAAVMEGTLGICLFFFAFLGMLCTMIQRIEDHAYEYAVYLLCGARIGEIYFMVVFEYLLIVFFGNLLSYFVFGKSLAFLAVLFLTCVCMIIIFIIVCRKIDSECLIKNLKIRG